MCEKCEEMLPKEIEMGKHFVKLMKEYSKEHDIDAVGILNVLYAMVDSLEKTMIPNKLEALLQKVFQKQNNPNNTDIPPIPKELLSEEQLNKIGDDFGKLLDFPEPKSDH